MSERGGERGRCLETVGKMLSTQERGEIKMAEKNGRGPELVGRD